MPAVNNNTVNYFLPGHNQEYDKKVSAEITQQQQRNFKDESNKI